MGRSLIEVEFLSVLSHIQIKVCLELELQIDFFSYDISICVAVTNWPRIPLKNDPSFQNDPCELN